MATDFRHTSKYLPRVSKEVGVKRGLRSDLPLEAKISDYYGPNPDNDRWLRRHVVFNHLYRRKEAVGDSSDDDCKQARRISKDLRGTFADLATKITPSKPRRKGKDKARVRKPDFDKQDETHANLLGTRRSELQENEVHSNFDFLSFYHRAFGLVLRLREEVLMSDDVRRSRAEDMNANPEPHNFQLITDLFRDLRIEPKAKKEEEAEAEEGAGQQISAKVVPLKQIRRVAEMMHDLTLAEGDVELRRAKLRVKGDWEGLKASYAAEEAEKENSGVEETVPRAESEDEVAPEVSGALAGLVPPLGIDNGAKRKFEADRDSEDGPTYTLGSEVLGQEHPQCDTKNRLDEPTSLKALDVAIDTQDEEVLSYLEDKRNDIRRKHEPGHDSADRPVHLLNSGGRNGACVEVAADEHIPTSIAPKADQRDSLGAQIRQVMGTAAATSLAAPINDDNKHSGAGSIGSESLATETRNKLKRMFHRITYSSTTSRQSHITAIIPSSSSRKIKLLTLTQPRKGSFHRFSGRKHRIAFHCYTRCAMARALHGQQTRLQRRMAIAVAELRKKARRDLAGKF